MLRPNIVLHKYINGASEKSLSLGFGLLVWNVHKNNQKKAFTAYMNFLSMVYKVDLLLFQEAKIEDNALPIFENFSFCAASNIKWNQNYYGVLSASYCQYNDSFALLSQTKEILLNTHKSSLLTKYEFRNAKALIVVNMHAINFKQSSLFKAELLQLLSKLKHQHCAMIVAGDFNTWNKKREQMLHWFCKELGLEKVKFRKRGNKIKSFLNHDLDHIFYKGLKLTYKEVLDASKLSDHNPLYAYFKLI